MPLTRINGKLGVATTGGRGDTYNINISAIDTQSGITFIQKNAGNIIGTMRQQGRLNNGIGRIA